MSPIGSVDDAILALRLGHDQFGDVLPWLAENGIDSITSRQASQILRWAGRPLAKKKFSLISRGELLVPADGSYHFGVTPATITATGEKAWEISLKLGAENVSLLGHDVISEEGVNVVALRSGVVRFELTAEYAYSGPPKSHALDKYGWSLFWAGPGIAYGVVPTARLRSIRTAYSLPDGRSYEQPENRPDQLSLAGDARSKAPAGVMLHQLGDLLVDRFCSQPPSDEIIRDLVVASANLDPAHFVRVADHVSSWDRRDDYQSLEISPESAMLDLYSFLRVVSERASNEFLRKFLVFRADLIAAPYSTLRLNTHLNSFAVFGRYLSNIPDSRLVQELVDAGLKRADGGCNLGVAYLLNYFNAYRVDYQSWVTKLDAEIGSIEGQDVDPSWLMARAHAETLKGRTNEVFAGQYSLSGQVWLEAALRNSVSPDDYCRVARELVCRHGWAGDIDAAEKVLLKCSAKMSGTKEYRELFRWLNRWPAEAEQLRSRGRRNAAVLYDYELRRRARYANNRGLQKIADQ